MLRFPPLRAYVLSTPPSGCGMGSQKQLKIQHKACTEWMTAVNQWTFPSPCPFGLSTFSLAEMLTCHRWLKSKLPFTMFSDIGFNTKNDQLLIWGFMRILIAIPKDFAPNRKISSGSRSRGLLWEHGPLGSLACIAISVDTNPYITVLLLITLMPDMASVSLAQILKSIWKRLGA